MLFKSKNLHADLSGNILIDLTRCFLPRSTVHQAAVPQMSCALTLFFVSIFTLLDVPSLTSLADVPTEATLMAFF